jgi:PAS domain S-box-containing protein
MTKYNIILITYVAIFITFWFWYELKKQRWNIFSLIKKQSIESVERKLYGFDESINPSIITDDNGVVTNLNSAAEILLGYKEVEMKGTKMENIIPKRFFQDHRKGIEKCRGREVEDKIFQLQVLSKGNVEIPIELRLRKRKIGKQFYYLAIMVDLTYHYSQITSLENVISELKKTNEIFDKGEEISLSGSWFWDIDKDVLIPSRGYKEICGLPDEGFEFTVSYLRTRVFPKDDHIINDALDKAFRGEDYDIIFRQIRNNDLKVITVRSRVRTIKNDNDVVKFIFGHLTLLKTNNLVEAIKE